MAKGLPCEKEKQPQSDSSPLCSRLLELWALGKISAKQAAEISHLAVLEGCSSSDIMPLAKCGNFGQATGNCHRDMATLFCKKMKLCEPMSILVDILDPNSREVKKEKKTFFPPHLVFSNLAEHYSSVFEELFAVKEEKCWEPERSQLAPPLALDKRVSNAAHTIPLFCHGDGAEFQSRDSKNVHELGFSFVLTPQSIPSYFDSLHTQKLHSASHMGTHQWLDCMVFFSLGKRPTPWSWPLWSSLGKRVGCLGWHTFDTWRPQSCSLEHSKGSRVFCKCIEVGGTGHKSSHVTFVMGKGQCTKARHVQKENRSSCREKMTKIMSLWHPRQPSLRKGVATHCLPFQGWAQPCAGVHIVYSRGVASHLAGSLLFYMCFFDGPGTRQKVSPTLRLQKIFSRIKELYVQNQVASRLTSSRLSMICHPNKPHKNFPVLEAKAAETKHFLPCLLAVIQEVLPPEEPIHEKMKICLAALVSIAGHFDSCGMFLSPKEFTTASNLCKKFFNSYHDLQQWALLKGQKLFHSTWKFHSFMHLLKDSRFMNYRCHHNYTKQSILWGKWVSLLTLAVLGWKIFQVIWEAMFQIQAAAAFAAVQARVWPCRPGGGHPLIKGFCLLDVHSSSLWKRMLTNIRYHDKNFAASSGWRVLRVPCGVQTHLQFLLICYLIFVSKNRCVSIDILLWFLFDLHRFKGYYF